MKNVQNTAEIQLRVINLVELYHTKVRKETRKPFPRRWQALPKPYPYSSKQFEYG